MKTIRDLQEFLGVKPDDKWGPISQVALDSVLLDGARHKVKASSFADPSDVARFRRCKDAGGSDQECFRVGDNGIGVWGDDTTADSPMCALPPEQWQRFGSAARGKKVCVRANGITVICELRDTMPHEAHITNGAGIDLNPAAVSKLSLTPPIMVDAVWWWLTPAE